MTKEQLHQGTFYRSYYEAGKYMPDEEKLRYYEKLFQYMFDGEETNGDGMAEAVFQAIKPNIKCSRERAFAGAKGGSKSKANGNQNASKNKAKTKQKPTEVKEKEKEEDKVYSIEKTHTQKIHEFFETSSELILEGLDIPTEHYGKALKEVDKFKDYWTEPNKSGTKVRWELEKTFDISRRLKRWFSNVSLFSNTQHEKRGKIAG